MRMNHANVRQLNGQLQPGTPATQPGWFIAFMVGLSVLVLSSRYVFCGRRRVAPISTRFAAASAARQARTEGQGDFGITGPSAATSWTVPRRTE